MKLKILLIFFLSYLSLPRLYARGIAEGYVVGWVENIDGEATGTPPYTGNSMTGTVVIANVDLSDAVAVSVGRSHSLALKHDGTVVGFGDNSFGQSAGTGGLVKIGGQILSNVVSIATGIDFSLALKRDGTVVTWGKNTVPEGISNVVAIAGGFGTSLALKNDGTVYEWGSDPSREPLWQVPNITNAIAIAIGATYQGNRCVALKKDGTVVHWGEAATPPCSLSNIIAIAAGNGYTLAVKKDGTVIDWRFDNIDPATGLPKYPPKISTEQVTVGGQILSNVVSVMANWSCNLALKKDGTVVAWGRSRMGVGPPLTVPEGLSNVVAIAVGENYCLAITTNKAVADKFSR